MKKVLYYFSLLIVFCFLFGCSVKSPEKMSLGGVEYDSKFVRSGYYFDKASFSDATFIEMLEKVEIIEKPSSLGEVELPDFSSFLLTNIAMPTISDSQIEAEINAEIEKETEYVPVKTKREAQMTDRVTIDFKGYVDGVAFEGGESDDYVLVLGSGAFIPGFEESVVGHLAGNQFTIDVTFPEYYDESLAGKDATFDITIKNIEAASMPKFDDEFVKKHTKVGSKNVAEYRIEVLNRIKSRNDFSNNQNLTYQLFEKLITDGKFQPTEEALAWQFSVAINQIKSQAEQSGMTLSDLFLNSGTSIIDSYTEIKSSIPEIIKEQMVFDFIINKYKVDITEKEVKEWFLNMTSLMGYGIEISFDDYIKYMGKEYVYDGAKQYKALTYALKDCHIIDEDVSINSEEAEINNEDVRLNDESID